MVWATLKNPAYRGTAAFGKTRAGELKPQRLRPQRGRPEQPRRPVSRVDTVSEEQILIDVPGLVSEDLFGAVQAQLEENRQRRRDRPGGGRYLLQGMVVCKRCGYGCYGKPTSRASAKGKDKVPYAYYRCTGSDAYRFGGQRLCWNKQIRTDMLDAAVWEDVRQLLSEPERVQREYERRLQGAETGPGQEVEHLGKLVSNVKKMISRLIDAYGEGLLDKSEFEPRISAARARLAKLEDEHRQQIGEAAQEAELRLVIGQLEEFSRRVSQELQEPNWETRREIVRALVKKVEIDEQEVRIVYRVSPSPFEGGPQQGRSQHCWGRDQHTTPSSQRPSGFVTITHPHHPLRGQRVEIIQFRRGSDPDLIIRLPDGHHAAIAMSGTDYASPAQDEIPPPPEHLLDLDGLRQARLLLDPISCKGRPVADHARLTPSDSPDPR